MKMYSKKSSKNKEVSNNVPNTIAYSVIRNFLNSSDFEEIATSCFIKKLNKKQTNQVMSDIKWLFKNYPGLEVMTVEDAKGNLTRFVI